MEFQFRIGCDIVDLLKFEKSLQHPQFIHRIYTEQEKKYCLSRPQEKGQIASFAARFAVKEAFSKAFGTGLYAQGVTPLDMWIEHENESGRPYLKVSPKLNDMLSKRKFTGWDVSLSHHGSYAMAQVLLW